MATEVSPGRFRRDPGEPCPRGSITEAGQTPCRGQLERIEEVMSGKVDMTCDTCSFQWDEFFQPGRQPAPRAPGWRLIPNELVEALAKANWDRLQRLNIPDPSKRTAWDDAKKNGVAMTDHIRVARETLEPAWPEFGKFFETVFGIDDPESERNMNARRAIEEIAIPAFERYEEKFSTGPKVRQALEAVVE